MSRWRKRSPLYGPRNISKNGFVALTAQRHCGFWTEPERGILQERATKFHKNGKGWKERGKRVKGQLLDLASARGADKNNEAAEFNIQD